MCVLSKHEISCCDAAGIYQKSNDDDPHHNNDVTGRTGRFEASKDNNSLNAGRYCYLLDDEYSALAPVGALVLASMIDWEGQVRIAGSLFEYIIAFIHHDVCTCMFFCRRDIQQVFGSSVRKKTLCAEAVRLLA